MTLMKEIRNDRFFSDSSPKERIFTHRLLFSSISCVRLLSFEAKKVKLAWSRASSQVPCRDHDQTLRRLGMADQTAMGPDEEGSNAMRYQSGSRMIVSFDVELNVN
jgi:hypothetical protein